MSNDVANQPDAVGNIVSYKISSLLGSIHIVPVREHRADGLWMGSYSITYDFVGNEVSRTDVVWNCRLYVE